MPRLDLAPMQEVTNLPFWRVVHRRGGPDVWVTEYFRVHRHSKPGRHILHSITEKPGTRPVVAQMIGRDIPHLLRTVRLLQEYPVAGIDLNLGCPAPIVCSKHSGGGLLRDQARSSIRRKQLHRGGNGNTITALFSMRIGSGLHLG